MFAHASAKFMSNLTRQPSGMTLKQIKAMTEDNVDGDMELNDDDLPPKIECEGNPNDIGKFLTIFMLKVFINKCE